MSGVGVSNVPGKHDIVPCVYIVYRFRYPYMKSEYSISYVISSISGATSVYADIVYDIVPDVE